MMGSGSKHQFPQTQFCHNITWAFAAILQANKLPLARRTAERGYVNMVRMRSRATRNYRLTCLTGWGKACISPECWRRTHDRRCMQMLLHSCEARPPLSSVGLAIADISCGSESAITPATVTQHLKQGFGAMHTGRRPIEFDSSTRSSAATCTCNGC